MARQGRELEIVVAELEKLHHFQAEVASPELVPDVDTGKLREVDVSVRVTTTQGPRFIAIECRDRGSVQDVTWVEQLTAKKVSIAADVLIAVSSSSFSEAARIKAEKRGILLRTVEEFSANELRELASQSYLELISENWFISSIVSIAFLDGGSMFHDIQTGFIKHSVKKIDLPFLRLIENAEPSLRKAFQAEMPPHGGTKHGQADLISTGYELHIGHSDDGTASYRAMDGFKIECKLERFVDRLPISSLHKYKDGEKAATYADRVQFGPDDNILFKSAFDYRTGAWHIDPRFLVGQTPGRDLISVHVFLPG